MSSANTNDPNNLNNVSLEWRTQDYMCNVISILCKYIKKRLKRNMLNTNGDYLKVMRLWVTGDF